MAVLTEAIEAAERGAGVATAGGLAAIETATAMTIARVVETSTAVVAARELALAPLLMTATIARRAVNVATRKKDATAAEIAADAARLRKGVVNRPNLPRMNAIDGLSSCSSWRLA